MEHDHDTTTADSSAAVVRAGQFWDHHAALLEACGGVIDVLSLAGVSVEERLGNVPRRFTEVIRHAVCCGAALALAAATLRSGRTFVTWRSGFHRWKNLTMSVHWLWSLGARQAPLLNLRE